jgi:hypothetical protein
MSSFCDKVKQFFRDVSIKDSCISSCCNTVIDKDDAKTTHKHHHNHKHKHKHKEHKPDTKKTQDEIER